MNITFEDLESALLVRVAGRLDSHSTGPLCDALVARIGRRRGLNLVIDLAGVSTLTRAGLRGLVVAAKLTRGAGGRTRISGADTPKEALLRGLGLAHLFDLDATCGQSVEALSQPATPHRASAPGGPGSYVVGAPGLAGFVAALRAEFAPEVDVPGADPMERVATACGFEDRRAMQRAMTGDLVTGANDPATAARHAS